MHSDSSQERSGPDQQAGDGHVLARAINERIHDLHHMFDPRAPIAEWFCECSDTACTERIQMSMGEYEEIRRSPARAAVLAGHELPEGDRPVSVVARHSTYVVVEATGVADAAGHWEAKAS
jgi:hypothetical protein